MRSACGWAPRSNTSRPQLINKHGQPLLSDVKQYIVEAMTHWNMTFEKAWIQTLEDVPKKPAHINEKECMICGKTGVVDINHCFFECTGTAKYTNKWRTAVENPNASLR